MIRIDRDTRIVYSDDQPVTLTAREYDLLVYLYERAGVVCTRDQLIDAVWGAKFAYDTGTLDVHIHSIRRKLHLPANSPIRTLRGVGYCYELDIAPSNERCDLRAFFNGVLVAYTPQWKALKMKVDLRLDPFVTEITMDTDILRKMIDAVMPLYLIQDGQLTMVTSLSVSAFTITLASPKQELKFSIPIQNA